MASESAGCDRETRWESTWDEAVAFEAAPGAAPGHGTELLILSDSARHALASGPLCGLEFQHGFALGNGCVRGSVAVSAAGEEGLAKIVVTLRRRTTAGPGDVRLETEVRRSWLRDVVEAADGRTMPAVAIAAAVSEVAMLPGQRSVAAWVEGEAAHAGQTLAESISHIFRADSGGEALAADVTTARPAA